MPPVLVSVARSKNTVGCVAAPFAPSTNAERPVESMNTPPKPAIETRLLVVMVNEVIFIVVDERARTESTNHGFVAKAVGKDPIEGLTQGGAMGMTTTVTMNDSGQGVASRVPDELKRWNWGAFLLSWIWGIGNATPLAFLCFVPLAGLVTPFVLGARGNEWAWRNRRWPGIDDFRRTQRTWAIAGAASWAACVAFTALIVIVIFAVLMNTEPYKLAEARLRQDSRIAAVFGRPLNAGFPMGSIKVSGPSGESQLSFSLEGPKSHGTAYVDAKKERGAWSIETLEVEVDGRAERIRLVTSGAAPER